MSTTTVIGRVSDCWRDRVAPQLRSIQGKRPVAVACANQDSHSPRCVEPPGRPPYNLGAFARLALSYLTRFPRKPRKNHSADYARTSNGEDRRDIINGRVPNPRQTIHS